MTKIARLAVAVLCLVAVLAAGLPSGACAPAPSDPKTAVVAAYKNLYAIKSHHMSVTQEIAMTFGQQRSSFHTAIEGDLQAKPLLYRSTVTFTFGGGAQQASHQALQYIQKEGDQFAVYSQANNKWVKQFMPYFDPYADYERFLQSVKTVTLQREDAATAVYEITIDARYLKQTLERNLAAFSGQKAAIPEDMLAEIGDPKYIVTIDKTVAMPVRMDIDMSALLTYFVDKIVLPSLPAGHNIAFTDIRATFSATLSRFNAIGKIVIPSEALAAPLMKPPAPAQSTGKE